MSSAMEDSSHPEAGGDIRGGATHHDGSGDVADAESMPRRSSRANFGIPPTRYAEWSTPLPHPRSQDAMPPPLLLGTVIAADGRHLTRTSIAASGEDDATSVSSRMSQSSIRSSARSSKLEENQVKFQRLDAETQQFEASMKQRIVRMQNQIFLLNQENSILEQQQQLEDEDDAALPFGADSAKPVNKDVQIRTCLSGILPKERVQRLLLAPRRPTVPPPPPPTPASSTERKGEIEGWSHGQRVFAASKAPTNPSVTVEGERRHPVPNKEEKESALPFGTDSARPVDKDGQMRTHLSRIIPDKRVHLFLPTPRRPTIPPPPPPTPAFSISRKDGMEGWILRQQDFAAVKPPTNPHVTVKGDWRHPVPMREAKKSYKPRFHGSTLRLGAPQLLGHGGKEASPQPVPTPSTGVVPAVPSEEALANALLKVLSARSKTTEKFVARQSLETYCAQSVEHRNSMGPEAETFSKAARAIAEMDSCDSTREPCQLGKDLTDVHKRGESTSYGCVESCVPRGEILPKSQPSNIAPVEAMKNAKDFADWSAAETEPVPRHLHLRRRRIGSDDNLPTRQCNRWSRWVLCLPEVVKVRHLRGVSCVASSFPDVNLHLRDAGGAARCPVRGTQWQRLPPSWPHTEGSWGRLVLSAMEAVRTTMMSQTPKEQTRQTEFAEGESHRQVQAIDRHPCGSLSPRSPPQ
ncbi:unnamed protein product [Orchesella dallaii]|uniref:Uncharacterized protein n=1 Tax=Orchesella dallaii TaxID=48710 RepID=A0ABP1RJR7_9HEXA